MSRTDDMKKIMEMVNLKEVEQNPFEAFASWGIINEDIPYERLASVRDEIKDNPAASKKWALRLGLRSSATPEQVLRVIKARMDKVVFPELSPSPTPAKDDDDELKMYSDAKYAITDEMKKGVPVNSNKFSVRQHWAIKLGLSPDAPYNLVLSRLNDKINNILYPSLPIYRDDPKFIPLPSSHRRATFLK